MGKAAKERKKRARLEAFRPSAASAAANSSADMTGGGAGSDSEDGPLSDFCVASACDTMRALLADGAALGSPEMRTLRTLSVEVARAVLANAAAPAPGTQGSQGGSQQAISSKNVMHRFTKGTDSRSDAAAASDQSMVSTSGPRKGLVATVSDALRDGRTGDAIDALRTMHRLGVVPRLGSMCRWVRDADAVRAGRGSDAGGNALVEEPDPAIVYCLDLVMRVADPERYPHLGFAGRIDTSSEVSEPWACVPLRDAGSGAGVRNVAAKEAQDWRAKFAVVHRQRGDERVPPNEHDLVIHTSAPNAIGLAEGEPAVSLVEKVAVPHIPSAFTLLNVLSAEECARIVSAAESVGYLPDRPTSQSAACKASVLAHNFVWLLDTVTEKIVMERVAPHLPQDIRGKSLKGINRRWRLYRYSEPGQTYRCHIDGGWTGSGTTKDDDPSAFPEVGEYLPDAYGDRSSRLTFLIYLNEGFEGGETTYFMPRASEPGTLEARRVAPRVGSVMVFPHSCTQGNLLHEGSSVTKGCKYIARTEVLFEGFDVV